MYSSMVCTSIARYPQEEGVTGDAGVQELQRQAKAGLALDIPERFRL
jgi:hypothetical protein